MAEIEVVEPIVEAPDSDDLTGSYLEAREVSQAKNINDRVNAFLDETPEPEPEPEQKFTDELARSAVEIASGEAFAAGIDKAFTNTMNLGEDIDNFMLSKGIDLPVFQFANPETGELDLDIVRRSEFNKRLEEAGVDNKLKQTIEAETAGGKLVEDITAFVAEFASLGKFIKAPQAAGKAVKLSTEAAKGALADFLAFGGDEGNISDLIQEYPDLRNPVTEFLAGEESDTELEGRFKNSLEGLGLGLMVEPFIKVMKGARELNKARLDKKQLAQAAEDAKKLAEVEPKMQNLEVGDVDAPAFEVKEVLLDEEIAEDAPKLMFSEDNRLTNLDKNGGTWQAIRNENPDIPEKGKVTIYRATVGDEIRPNDFVAANRDIAEQHLENLADRGEVGKIVEKKVNRSDLVMANDATEFQYSPKPKKAKKIDAVNINLARLNTTDDVKETIENIGKGFSKEINEARREVITLEETEKLADELGMSVKQLLDRRKGQAFNAEELLASRKILLSSGEQLTKLAREISEKGAEASPADLVRFQRALQQHKAIQSQVSGATAEAGRALSQFRITAKSAKEQEQLINEALNTTGGASVVRDKVNALANLSDPTQINVAARQMAKTTKSELVYQGWINGLLSNPATHAANILSNTITLATTPVERKVASLIGQVAGDPQIPSGEANAMVKGMMEAIPDAFRVMSHTMKTGIPQSQIQKIENIQRKARSSEALNLNGTMGRAADYLDEIVTLPGRALSASDDFFQLIAYRAELNAQAFRQATGEGLTGDDLAARVKDIVDNPPENIHSQATNFQHYATFTDEMGEVGQTFARVAALPGMRVIMPFVRTPSRVFAYAMERTPVAPALGWNNAGVGGQIREDIMAGGARRDLALAKMATGSWIMAMGAELAMGDFVTGGGPENPDLRKIWLETHKPYSIKVGDEWVAYNRLDPLSMPLGIAADITEAIGEMDEATALDIANAAIMGTASNVLSKNYVKGISDLFTAILDAKTDPDAKNLKLRRIIEGLVGSSVPSGVAAIARQQDEFLRSTYDADPTIQMINKIKSRLPGWSKDLKPRVNMFGEPIILGGGLGPDIMSPVYTNEVKEDALVEEILLQQTPLRMPGRSVRGIQLTHDEFYRLNILAGKELKPQGRDLRAALTKLVNSSQYKKGTDGPDGSKSLMLQTLYGNYKAAAQAKLIQESEGDPDGLAARIKNKKQERKQQLTGRL